MKKLNDIVGEYYNSKAGYYVTLQKLVTFYNKKSEKGGQGDVIPIHELDEAINHLKDGYEAVRYRGADIAYDGLNFEIKDTAPNCFSVL